jgi:hypothetical protein
LIAGRGRPLAIVLALATERWLDAGTGRERRGLTSDPLCEHDRRNGSAHRREDRGAR